MIFMKLYICVFIVLFKSHLDPKFEQIRVRIQDLGIMTDYFLTLTLQSNEPSGTSLDIERS